MPGTFWVYWWQLKFNFPTTLFLALHSPINLSSFTQIQMSLEFTSMKHNSACISSSLLKPNTCWKVKLDALVCNPWNSAVRKLLLPCKAWKFKMIFQKVSEQFHSEIYVDKFCV